jgi:hypothetical protein
MVALTAEEVKDLLKDYYDIPQKIAEEFATIRNCENVRCEITLPSVNLSGLPGGKGLPGDRTASMALTDITKYYDDEIRKCHRRIAAWQEKKNWLGVALDQLDKTDRYILEIRYMGDPKNRKYRRPPAWKEIADKTELSERQARERVRIALLQLTMKSDQIIFPGMIR